MTPLFSSEIIDICGKPPRALHPLHLLRTHSSPQFRPLPAFASSARPQRDYQTPTRRTCHRPIQKHFIVFLEQAPRIAASCVPLVVSLSWRTCPLSNDHAPAEHMQPPNSLSEERPKGPLRSTHVSSPTSRKKKFAHWLVQNQ